MNYQELKQKHQEEINNFPLGFAFSNEQFKEMMEKWGLTENDTDKIYSIGYGGFVQKKDSDALDEMFKRHRKEEKEFLSEIKNLENAIYYEMCNHEYSINYQRVWDVFSCFGKVEYKGDELYEDEEIQDYANQLEWNSDMVDAYKRARKRYYADAERNGWY